jgi:predicted ferric reductase
VEIGHWSEAPAVALAWLFVGSLLVGVMGWRWALRPLFNRGAHRVGAVRPESASTATLVLDPVEDRPTPAEPGQFVWLRRRRLVGLCVEHPFTIAASTRTGILELTVRTRGDFTRELLALPVGTKVWLDGPHGSFVPPEPYPTVDDPRSRTGGLILIAGGVGVTPMMSILRAHAAGGDPRPHRLLLAEKPDDGLFGPELLVLERRLDLSVRRTAGRRLDRAFLAESLPARHPERHEYFVCGPPGLMVAVLEGLGALGVPDERIHTEQFG